VSLREAVRPAIFAYSILATERHRAGALVDECDNLLRLTRELLKKSALAHVLTPEPEQRTPVTGGNSAAERQARLLDAYADAGLLWARVVGSCVAIADVLLERGEWMKVRHLSEVLSEIGESAPAKELSRRVKDGPTEFTMRRISGFNAAMSISEVSDAFKILIELPHDFPRRNAVVGEALSPVCSSIKNLSPSTHFHICSYIVQNGCPEHMVPQWFGQALSEFQQIAGKKR
jgi:hypothetical protein